LLTALQNEKKVIEEGGIVGEKEAGMMLLGVFEVLIDYLDLHPCRTEGEKLVVTQETARNFEFDENPESLGDHRVRNIEVEVLRCGWKIGDKVIQKPKVFAVS